MLAVQRPTTLDDQESCQILERVRQALQDRTGQSPIHYACLSSGCRNWQPLVSIVEGSIVLRHWDQIGTGLSRLVVDLQL